jgi:hypothetical protein
MPQQAVSTGRRRLLISSGDERLQVLSFTQSTDSSIYVTTPDTASCRWLELAGNPPTLSVQEIPATGKLSVHGSGIAHVRPGQDHDVELRLAGNYLANPDKDVLGVRHLCTVFPTQPVAVPATRVADCLLQTATVRPYVFVFWAVPAHRPIQVRVNASFRAEDLERVPPDSGFGSFTLRTHAVVWFAYRTAHMESWPAHSHFAFHDGFYTPTLIGTGTGACRLELREANYSLRDDQVNISM